MQGTNARVHQVQRATPLRVPILSVCPKCKRNQAQWYTHGALSRLLHGGHPVEGYCATCDEFWCISDRERTGLAMALKWTGHFAAESPPVANHSQVQGQGFP